MPPPVFLNSAPWRNAPYLFIKNITALIRRIKLQYRGRLGRRRGAAVPHRHREATLAAVPIQAPARCLWIASLRAAMTAKVSSTHSEAQRRRPALAASRPSTGIAAPGLFSPKRIALPKIVLAVERSGASFRNEIPVSAARYGLRYASLLCGFSSRVLARLIGELLYYANVQGENRCGAIGLQKRQTT
jgi:hypothetical protein